MSLVTITPELEHEALHAYLGALDKLGLFYHMTATSDSNKVVVLELQVDSTDSCVRVTLYPNSTWRVTAPIVVGTAS
jgi:hypothetical protein